ncbi:MAG TPA: PQQ-binding-like beta-propeller repeat protein [Candidatus Limnocylindrales bacterium]|nr:PQQ-binding-like beta-propeller repeat protein [Candidatus Limnocylindrales bacterium]
MMRKLGYLAVILISLISLQLFQSAQGEEVTDDRLLNAYQDKKNWLLYGRDYANQRYSPLDQIHVHNVKDLTLRWIYQTGKVGSFQTNPLVVDGVMYITTPYNHVIALDARTGKQIWRYEHKLRTEKFCCGPANRGAAVGYGKVYMATIDARLVALDQKTGKVIWDVEITYPGERKSEVPEPLLRDKELQGGTIIGATGYSANIAPLVYKGKVIIGTTGAGYGLHLKLKEGDQTIISVGGLSGGDHGSRGLIVAYDAQSGKEIWRWYSVPEKGWEGEWRTTTPDGYDLHRDIEAEKEAFPKYPDAWKVGGGSIWSSPVVDPELGLLYVGTGNPSPQMDDTTRPGDNLYTVSLVALDVETGLLKWYYQQVPHDRWDYDVASPPILLEVTINGQKIKAVGQASKLGWFYIHDRQTGKLLLKSEPFLPQENLFAKPTPQGVRITPAGAEGATWSPVAYSPQTEAVYISAVRIPSRFISRTLIPEEGKPWKSYTFFIPTQEERSGTFTAIHTSTGKILWQKKTEQPMVGGALATAGGLVFTGEGNGYFDAFDARTGELLWRFQCGAGVNAPPISYEIDGVQYIAVAAGGNTLMGSPLGDDILVFALPERNER